MTNAHSRDITHDINEAAEWVSLWIKDGKRRGFDAKKTREWVSHNINVHYILDKYNGKKGVFKKPICEGGKSGCGCVHAFFLGPEQFPQGYCAGCCEEAASEEWAEGDYMLLYDGKNLHPDIMKHAARLHEEATTEIDAKKGYSARAA